MLPINHRTFACLSHYISARNTGRTYGPLIRRLIAQIRLKYLDNNTAS